MTAVAARPLSTPSAHVSSKGHRWSWPQYLALIGAPILVLQVWTTVAWLSDDAHQVTQFRTGHTGSWWAARGYEALGIVIFIGVGQHVLRTCLRERRLTFDAMFLLTGMTMFWSDLGINLFGPAYLMSSNFVNLNSPLGHLPGVTNPDIGRAPDPILFTITLESAGILLGAWAIGWIAGKLRARNPDLSTPKLLLRLFLIGLFLDLFLEVPIIAFQLWTYPAPSWSAIPLGAHGSLKFPAFEWLSGGMVFLFCGMLRLFKDDKGRTIVERGMDHYSPAKRTGLALLATYACIQIIAWGPPTWIDLVYVPYETQWHQTPAHLLNDACDAPGVTGTRFGPCPGSPGYRMPTRTTHLEGPNP